MKLVVLRHTTNIYGTFGKMYLENEFLCDTLEPSKDTLKKGAIPVGVYELGERTTGGFYWRYKRRFKDILHKSMLHVKGVPGFKYILIHCGNKASDSRGCTLVGKLCNNTTVPQSLYDSTTTYKRVYQKIIKAIDFDNLKEIHYKT